MCQGWGFSGSFVGKFHWSLSMIIIRGHHPVGIWQSSSAEHPTTSPGNFNWTRPWSPRICVFPLLSWQKRFCEILHLWNRPRVFVHRISVSKPFRDVVGLLEIPTNDGWWVIHQRQEKPQDFDGEQGNHPWFSGKQKQFFWKLPWGFWSDTSTSNEHSLSRSKGQTKKSVGRPHLWVYPRVTIINHRQPSLSITVIHHHSPPFTIINHH